MKKLHLLLIACAGFLLAACTAAQTDKFIDGVQNFTRGLAAVDSAVKDVNTTLYANCNAYSNP